MDVCHIVERGCGVSDLGRDMGKERRRGSKKNRQVAEKDGEAQGHGDYEFF